MGESLDTSPQARNFVSKSIPRSKNGYWTERPTLLESILEMTELGLFARNKLRMGGFVLLGRCLFDTPPERRHAAPVVQEDRISRGRDAGGRDDSAQTR